MRASRIQRVRANEQAEPRHQVRAAQLIPSHAQVSMLQHQVTSLQQSRESQDLEVSRLHAEVRAAVCVLRVYASAACPVGAPRLPARSMLSLDLMRRPSMHAQVLGLVAVQQQQAYEEEEGGLLRSGGGAGAIAAEAAELAARVVELERRCARLQVRGQQRRGESGRARVACGVPFRCWR